MFHAEKQTDKHEANCRFHKFCEYARKKNLFSTGSPPRMIHVSPLTCLLRVIQITNEQHM
jgi:hypothetical protein